MGLLEQILLLIVVSFAVGYHLFIIFEKYGVLEPFMMLVLTLHIVISPFTKVEESFNMQAIHDILYHGFNLTNYDHFEFPGVVPRTFIGPLIVSICSYPIFIVGYLIGWKKFTMLFLVRFLFGVIGLQAYRRYMTSVYDRLGMSVSLWVQVITCTQFHYFYYLSRTLPNIFALVLVTLAYSFWLQRYHRGFVFASAAAVIIFRGELCILLGLIALYELWSKRIDLKSLIIWGVTDVMFMLTLTVAIDSVFWKRLLWPEGEVLWFNLVLNKSSEWGTLPFHWYFTSALPRALLSCVFFVPFGCFLDKRIRPLVVIALLYVVIYSFLPHKELRFIIYTIPLLNVSAARTYAYLYNTRLRSGFRNVVCFFAVMSLVANMIVSFFMLNISSCTYTGGLAMARLHEIESEDHDVYVHFDTLAAQTGITRFSELYPKWRYNKTEGIDPYGYEMTYFTHLIVEHPGNNKSWPYYSSHTQLSKVNGFFRWTLNLSYPFIHLEDKAYISVLKRIAPHPITVVETSLPTQTFKM